MAEMDLQFPVSIHVRPTRVRASAAWAGRSIFEREPVLMHHRIKYAASLTQNFDGWHIHASPNEWQAADVPIEREEGVRGGKNRAAGRLERHAHNAGAAEHDIGLSLPRDPHDAATPSVRGRHIEISVAIQSQALRPPEATEENAHIAALRDFVDAVKTGGRRPGNVQIAAGMKRQVISGDGGLERGKNKDLAARADLENRAAAVANVQIAVVIERDAGGDAHAFDPLLGAAIGRDAMYRSVVAAGDEQIAHAIERQAAGIHQRSDKRLH